MIGKPCKSTAPKSWPPFSANLHFQRLFKSSVPWHKDGSDERNLVASWLSKFLSGSWIHIGFPSYQPQGSTRIHQIHQAVKTFCQGTPLPSKELQPLAGVRIRGPCTSSIGYFLWISQQHGCRKLDFSQLWGIYTCSRTCATQIVASNPLAFFMNCWIETARNKMSWAVPWDDSCRQAHGL